MKRINKEGPAILGQFHLPSKVDAAALPELLARKALVIDTRPASEYAAGHVPGTINIPFNANFVTWAGWLVHPVQADEFYLIVDAATAAARLGELARELALIGIDRITGFFDAAVVTGRATIRQVTPTELAPRLQTVTVVDVRSANEWNEGHVPGALHIPLGYLSDRTGEIARHAGGGAMPVGRAVVDCRIDPRARRLS